MPFFGGGCLFLDLPVLFNWYNRIIRRQVFLYDGEKDNAARTQMEIAGLEEFLPPNYLVRKLDVAIDMSFIYEEVKDLYSDFGRESIDPESKPVPIRISTEMRLFRTKHAVMKKICRNKLKGIVRNTEKPLREKRTKNNSAEGQYHRFRQWLILKSWA